MALQDFCEDLVLVDKSEISDRQGGFITVYTDSKKFKGAIATIDNNYKTRIAEQQGVTSIYTITTDKDIKLTFHNLVKRISDGKIFRVTSNCDDMQTPQISSMSFWQVSAEKWELIK